MSAFPTMDEQHAQTNRWSSLLCLAGYVTELHGTGFDREWRVFASWNGPQIASIDIDGCGASWHGDDDLWLRIIGPSEGVCEPLHEVSVSYGTRTAAEAIETLGREQFGLGY